MKYALQLTACKRHNPAAGATQGYDRLHANRYLQGMTTVQTINIHADNRQNANASQN